MHRSTGFRSSPSFTNVTVTGQGLFADGTAGAPSIAWASDNDGTGTGFYRSGANLVSYSTNGAERVRFNGTTDLRLGASFGLGWSSAAAPTAASDAVISRAAANSLVIGGASSGAGTATTLTTIRKAVTSIANNSATATFTVTVPNAAHSANAVVTLTGSLGAGGAIGANESTASIKYNLSIARTAGVATVAVLSSAYGSAVASVAGAANAATTATISAMTGLVSATQTFTINVTIARSGGSSDNHTCLAQAELLNANATGVTIA